MNSKQTHKNSENGNTGTFSSRGRCWCFTYNNYNKEDVASLISYFVCAHRFVFQEEDEGTPHLQGYVQFKNQKKFETLKNKFPKCHWEKTKSKGGSTTYCSDISKRKGKIYSKSVKIEEHIVDPLKGKKLHDYQVEILEMIEQEPNERSVHWYWETKGNTGKTSLAKCICLAHNAIYLSGKAADMKHAIVSYKESVGVWPSIVILDLTRSSEQYVSYQGIEEVKNGIFFSGKYESGMAIFNSPHLIIFANFKPDKQRLSKDRWVIKKISTGDHAHQLRVVPPPPPSSKVEPPQTGVASVSPGT